MNIIFRISIIKSVGDIGIGSIGTDYRVLCGRFPQRKNRYVGSTVGVKCVLPADGVTNCSTDKRVSSWHFPGFPVAQNQDTSIWWSRWWWWDSQRKGANLNVILMIFISSPINQKQTLCASTMTILIKYLRPSVWSHDKWVVPCNFWANKIASSLCSNKNLMTLISENARTKFNQTVNVHFDSLCSL